MAFLTAIELKTVFYKKAANMDADTLDGNLRKANAFAKGVIGGVPPTVDDDLKAAVALAFEVMVKGETAQVDDLTGNITEAAPAGYFVRRDRDPLDVVREMLQPYKDEYDLSKLPDSSRGVRFI